MSGKIVFEGRLEEADIVKVIQYWIRARGLIPPDEVGLFKWRFKIIGDPQITLIGDAVDMPNAGDMYLLWAFEPLENVQMLPVKKGNN